MGFGFIAPASPSTQSVASASLALGTCGGPLTLSPEPMASGRGGA